MLNKLVTNIICCVIFRSKEAEFSWTELEENSVFYLALVYTYFEKEKMYE